MLLFWILWIIDAIVALIALYFFFIGLVDGSVSSFNGGLWAGMLIGLAVLLAGTWYLKEIQLTVAKILLGFLAVPAVGFGLFMLIAILTKAKWN
jgi:hypothetical protein